MQYPCIYIHYLVHASLGTTLQGNVSDMHNVNVSIPHPESQKCVRSTPEAFASYINPLHSKLIPEQLPETPLHHWKPNISPHPRFLL